MDDSEEQESEPKISLVEAILIGILLCFVSLINLIPLVGDITGPVFGALMFLYLYLKGVWGTSVIATNATADILEMIPFLQWLPSLLVAWIITIIIDRNPKLEAVAEKVGEMEGGGGVAGEAAGAAEGAAAGVGEAAAGARGAATEAEGEVAEGARAETGSEKAKTGRKEGASEAAGEGEGGTEEGEGKTPEQEEKVRKDEEIDREMRSGAEVPPDEELDEELFDPNEVRFREARDLSAKRAEEEEEEGTEGQGKGKTATGKGTGDENGGDEEQQPLPKAA